MFDTLTEMKFKNTRFKKGLDQMNDPSEMRFDLITTKVIQEYMDNHKAVLKKQGLLSNEEINKKYGLPVIKRKSESNFATYSRLENEKPIYFNC